MENRWNETRFTPPIDQQFTCFRGSVSFDSCSVPAQHRSYSPLRECTRVHAKHEELSLRVHRAVFRIDRQIHTQTVAQSANETISLILIDPITRQKCDKHSNESSQEILLKS